MSKSGKQSGLGRGLSALLGEFPEIESSGAVDQKPVSLPIDLIQRNPDQPRRYFAEAKMQQLVDSVKKQGVLQPILVRPIVGTTKYQLVAGERRWRAAGQAGLHDIPVYVRELSDRQVAEIALVENIQRVDLNPIEEGRGYHVLMKQFHHTQEEVAKAVAKSRSHIANTVRLLDLPKSVQEHLVKGDLTAGHARALLSAKDALSLARRVIEAGLSVRQTENMVRESLSAPEIKSRKNKDIQIKDPDIRALEAQLSDALGLVVAVEQKTPTKGVLRLEYQTLEQLDDLCRRLNSI
ncbi:MAG: ParB/RepB/Spo0J family partition protein [Robiginitomaculum sp.]|nr:ParB/RepB/Spo0J family partition protein [Robiginitomaculum sp.]